MLPTLLSLPTQHTDIRDFGVAMAEVPGRVLRTVGRLGAVDPGVRPAGLMFEDPSGGVFPFELGPQVARVRQVAEMLGPQWAWMVFLHLRVTRGGGGLRSWYLSATLTAGREPGDAWGKWGKNDTG